MRLDLFLKSSRIIKRRVVASELIKNNNCFINNKLAKASSQVDKDDIVKLELPLMILTIRIVDCNNKNNASYELISKEPKNV